MKILYAASEATPYAKSPAVWRTWRELLPKALVKDGVDARVIMPLYGDLKYREDLVYVTNCSVPVGWRSQYCGLFRIRAQRRDLLLPGQRVLLQAPQPARLLR